MSSSFQVTRFWLPDVTAYMRTNSPWPNLIQPGFLKLHQKKIYLNKPYFSITFGAIGTFFLFLEFILNLWKNYFKIVSYLCHTTKRIQPYYTHINFLSPSSSPVETEKLLYNTRSPAWYLIRPRGEGIY